MYLNRLHYLHHRLHHYYLRHHCIQLQAWPFKGAIAIQDGSSMIVVDQWCYLGAADSHDELFELVSSGQRNFDLDIFKIIKKALRETHKDHVVQLNTDQSLI